MRKSLNDIVVEELQSEHDEIIDYRKAVASGIEDYDHPVLDDVELTNALEKVINHYKTKVRGYNVEHTLDYESALQWGDINFGDNLEIDNGTPNITE